jgi:hypothetical protein
MINNTNAYLTEVSVTVTTFSGSLWCGTLVLKEASLGLFDIACTKDAFVAYHLENPGGSIQWNMSFARVALDWEVNVFASFFQVLYLGGVRRKGEDKLWWIPSKKRDVWF